MAKLKRFIFKILYWVGWCYLKTNDIIWREEQAKGWEPPWRYRVTEEEYEKEKRGFLSCLFIILFAVDLLAIVFLKVWLGGPWWIILLVLSVIGILYLVTEKRFRNL